MTRISTLRTRLIGVAVAALLALSTPVFAATVQYNTTGMFSATGTNVLTGTPGDTLTFNAGSAVDNTPVTDSLGFFQNVTPSGGSLTATGTFTLNLTQVAPPGNGTLAGNSITGTISNSGSGPTGQFVLTFNQTSLLVNGITYTLIDLGQGGLAANQLGIGANRTDIEANITGTSVPEPVTMGLLGGGLALLGIARWRRSAKKD